MDSEEGREDKGSGNIKPDERVEEDREQREK